MKVKSFQTYLEKRLNRKELIELERQAEAEYQALRALQQGLADALNNYVKKEKIGFNELVRRLGISPSQAVKMQQGTANVTLATLAHVAALLKKQPRLLFKNSAHDS